MILIEEGLTLTCSCTCLKTSVVEFIFEHLHKTIKENTSGKYIHRAINLNCFFSFSKITITCWRNWFLFWVTSFQHNTMQLYQFFKLHQNLRVRK